MTTTGPEPFWQKAIRVVLGWGTGAWVLFGPLPYPIPWWGRFVVAFLLISIAHSTVSGIVLRNVASSGPRIVGLFRGIGIADRRSNDLGLGEVPADATQVREKIYTRRKSDSKMKR